MRKRYRYDPDLECLVEIGSNSNYFEEKGQAPSVISDDLGAGVNGLMHFPSKQMLDSKSAHYRETRARGLEHVGNEQNFETPQKPGDHASYIQATKDAAEQIAGDYQGTRGWLERQREQGRNIRWNDR